MKEPKRMSLYMDEGLFDRIYKEAKKDGRTSSSMVRCLLNEAFMERAVNVRLKEREAAL